MRATVYMPADDQTSANWTNAESINVDVETLDELLADLADKGPLGTRVIAHDRGTTHYRLTDHGWETVLRVVA